MARILKQQTTRSSTGTDTITIKIKPSTFVGIISVVALLWFLRLGVEVNVYYHQDEKDVPGAPPIPDRTAISRRRARSAPTRDFVGSGTVASRGVIHEPGSHFIPPKKPFTVTKAPKIGYFVSITKCGSGSLVDGAAVLKHAIHLASVHGNLGGKYDYQMHAIYHPEAEACVNPLKELGYKLERRETPVDVEEIEGEYLRRKIQENGCCGEKELIKLEAYTFTQYPVVVHLDLDTVILKPLDKLFDAMINGPKKGQIDRMWPEEALPEKINAFFTRDFNMVNGARKFKPVQGGFLVLRPDKKVYDEYVAVVKEGNFQEGRGWGGMRVGPFYGSMTIQGLLPYYYDVLHPGESVDLNNCVYNQMVENPRDQKTVNDVVHGKCRTGREECEDCRSRPVEDIYTTHFTLCQKPWMCLPHDQDMIQHRLCKKLFHEWYRIRADMEASWGRGERGPAPSSWKYSDHFYGYCKAAGKRGYVPIEAPYGRPTTS